jgi:PTS system nitrogen regulatory IIA component
LRLGSLIRPDLVLPDLPNGDRAQVLRALAERVAGRGVAPDAEKLYRKLLEREQLGSTGIGGGVAIPHCKLEGLSKGVVAIGMVPEGVDFGAVDGRPVRLFFLVASPAQAPAEHLQILAAISRWIKGGQRAEAILELRDPGAVYDFLQREGG